MAETVFKNCVLDGEITDITVKDGVIAAVGKSEAEGIDVGGLDVYPGLVDIHCHGVIGFDTMDGDKLEEMSEFLLGCGTTSWLPTTMSMDFDSIKKATDSKEIKKGANVLGFHMEGPYISKKYKGAMNEEYIKNPDMDEFKKFNNMAMVTIAPELPGSMEFIKNCDAVVTLGHTDCSYHEAIEAIENGARCLTHTFNAMPPLHHREPGLIGAAIDKNIYVQVISDGIHLHPAVVRMLYKLFGKERMILISDAMIATGLEDGEYEFGGQIMIVKDKIARTQTGALAGSTVTLMDCVKRAIEFGIPKEDAIYMATSTPSNLMKVKKGHIKPGYDADFIVLDKDMEIRMTVLKGEVVK